MQRLHQDIINQEPISRTTFVSGINGKSDRGLTSLQLAAREGRLNVVLDLIFEGAAIDGCSFGAEDKHNSHTKQSLKSPLYLALEYGHAYIAKILMTLGASTSLVLEIAKAFDQKQIAADIQHLKIDEHLLYAYILWLIDKENTLKSKAEFKAKQVRALERILPKLAEVDADNKALYGVLNFVLQQKQNHFVRPLLAHINKPFSISSYTPGYWAVKNDLLSKNSLFSIVCLTEEDLLLTLQQLHADRNMQGLELALKTTTEKVKKEFAKNPLPPIANVEEKLSDSQKFVYSSASRGDMTAMAFLIPDPQDVIPVLTLALAQKNFIAFHSLKEFSQPQPLMQAFLDEKCEVLPEMCFFNFNLSSTLAVSGTVLHAKHLSDLIAIYSSPRGYAHQLISTGVKRDMLPSKEMLALVKSILPTPKDYVTTVVRCVQDRYQIKSLHLAEDILKKVSTPESPVKPRNNHYVVTKTQLSPHDLSLMTLMLDRFDISLRAYGQPLDEAEVNSLETKIPSAIWRKYIIPCLSKNGLKDISTVSQKFYEYTLQAEAESIFNAKWHTYEKLWRDIRKNEENFIRLADEMSLLSVLVQEMQKDLKSKPCVDWSGLFCAIIIVSGLIAIIWASFDYLGVTGAELDKIKDDLACTMTSYNKTCAELNYYKDTVCGIDQSKTLYIKSVPECHDLCSDYFSERDLRILPILGIVFGFMLSPFALSSFGLAIPESSKYDETQLSVLPTEINDALDEINQAFPALLPYADPTMTRLNLFTQAQAALTQRQTQHTTLIATTQSLQTQAETPIVITLEDTMRAREEKIQSRTETIRKGFKALSSNLINSVSPARIMGGLYNLFQTQRSIEIDGARVPLLCGEQKSDDEEDEEQLELISGSARRSG